MFNWRPIDTAPKDGTPFIGARFDEWGMSFCGSAFWETPEDHRQYYSWSEVVESEGVWCSYYEQYGAKCGRETQELTHWVPLPGGRPDSP